MSGPERAIFRRLVDGLRTRQAFGRGVGVIAAAAVAVIGGLWDGVSPASAAKTRPPALAFPDLVAEAPERVAFSYESVSTDPFPHLLVRFDSLIHNIGPGPLELHGIHPTRAGSETVMSDVFQRVYYGPSPGPFYEDLRRTPGPVIYFETMDDHNHFHLRDAISYELTAADGSVSFPFAKHEAGFCLLDKERVDALGPPYFSVERFTFCQQTAPDAPEIVMGVSPGWQDRYVRELTGQWVDASLASPGEYRLAGIPNLGNLIAEANTANNIPSADKQVAVTIPGYAAEDVYARTSVGVPGVVVLQARKYEGNLPGAQTAGPANYLVATPPKHGTLSQPTGQWLRGGVVSYIPAPGFQGEDTFTYQVRDEDHPYLPRFPITATVTIHVGLLPAAPL